MASVDDRFFNVDRHGSLKVPGVLWVSLAFLARHIVLVAVVFAMAKRSPEIIQLLGHDFSWMVLPLELPAVALMLAAGSRSPRGGAIVRALWRHARAIILFTVAMHLLWIGWVLWSSDVWRRWPELFLASCGLLDLAIAYGFSKDDYYRQLFADFPAPATPERPA